MSEKYTPGPWFSDNRGNVWSRRPEDLYENGGSVAGDKPVAVVIKGWYGEGEKGFPVEANARLIAAAPKLLNELQNTVVQMDLAAYCIENGRIDEALLHLRSLSRGRRDAIAKATGEPQ